MVQGWGTVSTFVVVVIFSLAACDCSDGSLPGSDTGMDASDGGDGSADTGAMDSSMDATDTDTAECAVDSDCDDGLFCNGVEACDAGECSTGTPPDCDDEIDCTTDSCDDAVGMCQNIPDDALCTDGETCSPATGCLFRCTSDADCNDARFCNGAESCDAGDCVVGTPPSCSDGVDCTSDACDDTTSSCENIPDDSMCPGAETCSASSGCIPECTVDSDCDDGSFCNGAEACVSGSCTAGAPIVCDDSIACTSDYCDDTSSRCRTRVDDSLCAPGDICTRASGCIVGPCLVDGDCDDDVFCNGMEVCSMGSCTAGAPVVCDDSITCTLDLCDEAVRACDNRPDATLCPAGDVCSGTLGCVDCVTNADCSDGVFCNGAEICNSRNLCRPRAAPSCNDGVDCTVDSCDGTIDACANAPDDSMCGAFETCYPTTGCGPECFTNEDCQNGIYCDGRESCIAGRCFDRPNPDCNDGVACTVDACVEATRSCVSTPDDGRCSGAFICSPSMDCIPGCTTDSQCDDGLFCNGAELCLSGSCASGTPPADSDGVSCTFAVCNETTDTVGPQVPDDSFCDDGMACNGVETCDPILDCQFETEPGVVTGTGCAHSFTDISSTGMEYSCGTTGCDTGGHPDDDALYTVPLGGTGFSLYGDTATVVEVGVNGTIRFDSGGSYNVDNACLATPSLATGVSIAVFWDDLDLGNDLAAQGLHHQYFTTCPRAHDTAGPLGCNIIQWTNVQRWPSSTSWNMQAILYEGRDDLVIVYDGDMLNAGASATIGIQNTSPREFLEIGCNDPGSVSPDSSICFYDVPRTCP